MKIENINCTLNLKKNTKIKSDMEIRESFVSVKVAKLLREKGFNKPSIPFSSSWEQEKWFSEYFVEEPNPNYDPSIPFDFKTFKVTLPHVSLSLATKWLRETKNIHIFAYFASFGGFGWKYEIQDLLDGTNIEFKEGFKTYEDAINNALEYTLENLDKLCKGVNMDKERNEF